MRFVSSRRCRQRTDLRTRQTARQVDKLYLGAVLWEWLLARRDQTSDQAKRAIGRVRDCRYTVSHSGCDVHHGVGWLRQEATQQKSLRARVR